MTNFYDFLKIIKIVVTYPITITCFVPALWSGILKNFKEVRRIAKSKLKTCLCAGEYLNNDVFYSWKQMTGLDIKAGYGQTELGLTIAQQDNVVLTPGSIGKPLPGYAFEILDDNHNVLKANEIGSLALALKKGYSNQLFKEYMDDEERTNSVFVGDYYMTGDLAKIDEKGYVWYCGRNDDMINRGIRIGPMDIESMLEKHPLVSECAVIGKFSPDQNQEIIKAFIKLKENQYRDFQDIYDELRSFSSSSTSTIFCPQEAIVNFGIPRDKSNLNRYNNLIT
ncbi:acyl-coenzyme A synthetase ACSM4, mitochondrial-like [Gordionus sp. m RMFG-2023]|uniref:acyl-coenzyme A synthetase ACSM4, mitochondrial-like n=1 Tax=Gordionus sp. m RMFG-2023 TaxID=3053472 RepID=UPI0031FC95A1